MEREEIEAIWEHIKELQKNQLKVSKALSREITDCMDAIVTSGMAVAGKLEAYRTYMEQKIEQVHRDISNAQSVDSVIELVHKFKDDVLLLGKSLLKVK